LVQGTNPVSIQCSGSPEARIAWHTQMGFLPRAAFGFNLNNVLAYTTSKQVTIHDRHLGCLYYGWVILVLAWVCGFQIFYGNNHYKLRDVRGDARLTIQQPTKGCNPNKPSCKDNLKPLTELPYCNVYEGKAAGPDAPKHRRECLYADQHELLPNGMLEGNMFVPTRIDKMVEEKHCTPDASNGYKCDKLWMMKENNENTYVADIEDYTVMVVSSYHRASISGTSTDHQGFYYECRDKETGKIIGTQNCKQEELKIVKVECLPFLDCGYKSVGKPPRSPAFLRKRASIGHHLISAEDSNETSEFTPGPVFAIPDGDIFRFSKILELAGLSLDGNEKNGESLRERGSRVKIQVEYANLYPWTGPANPGYIYKIVNIPMNEMKTEMYTHNQPGSYPEMRTMENRHGIYLEAEVGGSFGFFDIVFLLVMLTTSLALLATGTTIIDVIADYIPGLQVKRDKYDQSYPKDHSESLPDEDDLKKESQS